MDRMSAADFQKRYGHNHQADTGVRRPKPKPDAQRPLVKASQSVTSGKAGARQRITIRITGYRVRPLDPDNFAGGTKAIVDQLRYCGLIPNDDPETICLTTDQVKVAHYYDQKTEIEISYP